MQRKLILFRKVRDNMRRKLSLFMAMGMLAASITGCSLDDGKEKETGENSTQTNVEANSGSESNLNPDFDYEKYSYTEEEYRLYTELFDLNNFVSVQLEISQEEIDKLQADYEYYEEMESKSPIYRLVDKVIISIGDKVYEIEEVGIKLKGNTSRVPVYDEDTGELNLSHYKLSFNETFDNEEYYGTDVKFWATEEERQARKDRRFATLKDLEIKWNKNYDDTYIRELYANEIFREAGVLAQRVNVSSFGINGENYGVVNIYEPVDEIFIAKNLPKEDWGGDLYKCGWTFMPANYEKDKVTYGIEDEDMALFYNYDLKSNKKESTFESIIGLLDTLDKSDLTREEFESKVDKDYLMNFHAASYFVGNPDDMRNNYNNHYVYFLASTGKAIFIPYDTDRCLGVTYGWNPDESGTTELSPFTDKTAAGRRGQSNPLITKTILEDGFYVEDYKNALAKVASSELWKIEKFEEYYEKAKANYETLVTPTVEFANQDQEFKFSLEGEFTTATECNMSFEEYVKIKMETYNEEIK